MLINLHSENEEEDNDDLNNLDVLCLELQRPLLLLLVRGAWQVALQHNLGIQDCSLCIVGKCYTILTNGHDDWLYDTRSLEAFRAPTSSWRPLGPRDFVLRALRPCDPHR